jgi:hypothetical protein
MIFLKRGATTEKDIKPGSGIYSPDNPEYRKSYEETMERVRKENPRDLAPDRRRAIHLMRFVGKTPALVAKSAAIRAVMSKEINS